MQGRYGEHADFLTVYIKEAHPLDEWQMDSNVEEDVCYRQPRSLAERVAIANDFVTRFRYPLPLLVDDMGNEANALYAGWPERLYVIEPGGAIAYKGEPGPFGFHPEEVEAWLAERFPEAAEVVPAVTTGGA
jgi:type I thyroxine 5'-deiodinase